MSYKMMQNIHEELDKIAEKGLNTSNLETAYKLIDMWKDMENVEYWKCKEEYYNQVMDEMDGGEYSEAHRWLTVRVRPFPELVIRITAGFLPPFLAQCWQVT